MDGWDGTERRETVRAADAIKPKGKTVEIPFYAILAALAALFIVQLGSLWSHKILGDHQDDEAEKNQVFRSSITCFLVEFSRRDADTDPLDVLTKCQLLGLPANGTSEVPR